MNDEQKTEGRSTVFDQFALADLPGVDLVFSSRLMKVLRLLRKNGPTTEGLLASGVREKIFLHEWTLLMAKLIELGYVTSEPTGRGLTKLISLTPNGEALLHEKIDPKPKLPEPEPCRGLSEAVCKEFNIPYTE